MDRHLALIQGGTQSEHGLLNGRAQVEGLTVEGDGAQLDVGEVEILGDEALQLRGVLEDDAKRLLLACGHPAEVPLEYQLEITADRGQRRPELMGDGRDELLGHAGEASEAGDVL